MLAPSPQPLGVGPCRPFTPPPEPLGYHRVSGDEFGPGLLRHAGRGYRPPVLDNLPKHSLLPRPERVRLRLPERRLPPEFEGVFGLRGFGGEEEHVFDGVPM